MGAWIEIIKLCFDDDSKTSLPPWERGLKYDVEREEMESGQWSLPPWERGLKSNKYIPLTALCSRSPRGSVD